MGSPLFALASSTLAVLVLLAVFTTTSAVSIRSSSSRSSPGLPHTQHDRPGNVQHEQRPDTGPAHVLAPVQTPSLPGPVQHPKKDGPPHAGGGAPVSPEALALAAGLLGGEDDSSPQQHALIALLAEKLQLAAQHGGHKMATALALDLDLGLNSEHEHSVHLDPLTHTRGNNSTTTSTSGCHLELGDTAFMLFATTVVFLQTPAMGLAQAGLIRRKNSLSMMMQVITGMAIGSLLWWAFGFSLAFGPSHWGVIGDFTHVMMLDVPVTTCMAGSGADTIPAILFASFHMMFALMTPVIVTGSWTEKMTFIAFLMFVTLWPIVVYYPLAHWIWNAQGWLNQMGILDFAGGMVIHGSTGTAGFVVSHALQRRKSIHHQVAYHNLPLTFIGAGLIWGGWYSFNGGSAFAANYQAAGALANTHLSACTGALTWLLLAYRHDGKWHLTEFINGAFAGLAGITPGSGYVEPMAAVATGVVVGCAAHFSVKFFKEKLMLDDVLDVTSLQGCPGLLGSILVGLWAQKIMHPGGGGEDGVLYGGGMMRLYVQLLGVAVTIVWSGFWTWLIMKLMKSTVGIDITPEMEEKGLDFYQIGEQAYDISLGMAEDLGQKVMAGKICEAAAVGDLKSLKRLLAAGGDPSKPDYDSRTPLHLAACEGKLEAVEMLLAAGANVNSEDKFGGTPLMDALNHKREAVVRLLRKHGGTFDSSNILHIFSELCQADNFPEMKRFIRAGFDVNAIDYDMRTPMMLCAQDGKHEALKILLKAGASVAPVDRWGNTALAYATQGRFDNCVRLLQSATDEEEDSSDYDQSGDDDDDDDDDDEGNASGPSALKEAGSAASTAEPEGKVSLEHQKSVDPLNRLRRQGTLPKGFQVATSTRELCAAALEGDLDECRRLVDKGADPALGNYDHRTPLHLAADKGALDVVIYLVEQCGVNVNAMDRWRQTPLLEAMNHNHLQVGAWLREHGAIVISRNLGFQLCKLAADGNLQGLKGRYYDVGCDMSVGDATLRTPLHLAACNGHVEVVKWLLSTTVDLEVRDRHGNTPIDDAKRYKRKKIVALLEKAVEESKAEAATPREVPSLAHMKSKWRAKSHIFHESAPGDEAGEESD